MLFKSTQGITHITLIYASHGNTWGTQIHLSADLRRSICVCVWEGRGEVGAGGFDPISNFSVWVSRCFWYSTWTLDAPPPLSNIAYTRRPTSPKQLRRRNKKANWFHGGLQENVSCLFQCIPWCHGKYWLLVWSCTYVCGVHDYACCLKRVVRFELKTEWHYTVPWMFWMERKAQKTCTEVLNIKVEIEI